MDTPVLIAGAGPVGLVLAADLAWRGVDCVIVDPTMEVNPHPRAISIGVRSMEHFRRLGLDQAVIDAGVPRTQALDVIYVTRMFGREIHRFPIPSIAELATPGKELVRALPEVAAAPYYKTWTAQAPLERLLRRHILAQSRVDARLGWRLQSFSQGAEGVDAIISDDATGKENSIRAAYLVGCDGASSVTRAGLGARLTGRGTLGAALGLYFRAPALARELGVNKGVMYWILAPGCNGVIYTIDGGDEWVFNRYFAPGEQVGVDDPVALIKAAIGAPIDVELISALDWKPRQLVADSYGAARVFLAGDACHLFVPTGGFGMNTGIGDVVDLAWKLEATVSGWGGAGLLASYDQERRPIGGANTNEAADNYARSGDIFAGIDNIEDDGDAGHATRDAIARRLPPKIKHFAPIGVHLGYAYQDSPIIIPDGTPAPAHEAATYNPTTRPGHRAPHAWLAPDCSTLDLFGRGFVLLDFGTDSGASIPIQDAARNVRVPLRVESIANPDIAALYGRRFVLVRPDGHVAWRGDVMPVDPVTVINRARGEIPS